MIFTVLTLFPEIFKSPLSESIIKKAVDKGLLSFNIINIRDFAQDIHRTCDDSPYGGGPGMVMKVEPIHKAMKHVETEYGKPRFVLLSPQGRVFDQQTSDRLSKVPSVCLICGRYEGVDERLLQFVDEEISIGDFVVSGGEFPALIIIDSVARCIPGVLGNEDSIVTESFREHLLEYAQYTRPDIYLGESVPEVLLSGNHERIRKWRRKESIRRTILRRPDLLNSFTPCEEDKIIMKEVMEEITE